MSRTTKEFRIELAKHFFHNLPMAGIGDAAGLQSSTASGSWWVSLHTEALGEDAHQNTSEADYGGYARVAVPRNAAGWGVMEDVIGQVAGEVTNAAQILFPRCTSGSSTITHIGIGTSASGQGKLHFFTQLAEPVSVEVTPGQAPVFEPGEVSWVVS